MPAGSMEINEQHLAQLRALLQRHVPHAEVWAYGSRVSGGGHQASDVDIVLRNPRDLTKPQDAYWELKEALSESQIPLLVDVLDWARIPESFREEIVKAYVVIQTPRGGG